MARIKYFDPNTGTWKYADSQYAVGSGGNAGFVAQDTPPEDTTVLWVNTSYEEEEPPGSSVDIQEAVNTALAQAKESGLFDGEKGDPGDDYVLTSDDKTDIAEMVAELVDVPGSGGSTVSSEWVLVADVTTEGDDLREIKIDKDSDGNSFEFREIVAFFNGTTLNKELYFSVTSSDGNRPVVKQAVGTMPVVFYANELFLMCGDNTNFARLAQKYEHHNEKISQVRITSKWWSSEFFTSGTTLKLYGRK